MAAICFGGHFSLVRRTGWILGRIRRIAHHWHTKQCPREKKDPPSQKPRVGHPKKRLVPASAPEAVFIRRHIRTTEQMQTNAIKRRKSFLQGLKPVESKHFTSELKAPTS
jgi:hypothetical protein